MKKIFTILGALALITVCNAANAIEVMGAECEQIAVGEPGEILVKCPATDALRAIQAGTPDAMIYGAACDMIDCDAMIADTESVYVDIVENDCAPDITGYRVVIQNPNLNEFYAVTKCAE